MTESADPTARREQRRVEEYKMRKGIHDHEWTLLSGRVAAYLSSQALLATGAALLFGSDRKLYWPVLFLSVVGVVISVLSSLATCINCTVLNDSHVFIQNLIAQDEADGYLKGFYIPRKQPDRMHKLSTDLFSIGIPYLGGAAWMFVFAVTCVSLMARQDDISFYIVAIFCWALVVLLWLGCLLHIRSSWSLLDKTQFPRGS